ncbi:MAG: hypothetical protein WAK82_11865 [Streptosporangiaceae bacterium]
MSRRRFMARTSAAIGGLVTQLALEPAERADVQTRMARYNRDCGCAMGGAFMVAALLTSAIYIVVTARFAIGVIGAGIGFVVVCSMLGKALGLVVASVRLGLLRRSLARRARRTREESHVYVH